MITGVHAIMYSKHAESVRRFLGEILGLDSVDAGEGWLHLAGCRSSSRSIRRRTNRSTSSF